MTAPRQLKGRAWPGAFLRSLGHASWAVEQTATGINFLGSRHSGELGGAVMKLLNCTTLDAKNTDSPCAALYLRSSAGRQAENDLSIPEQRTDDRRPELHRLLDLAAGGDSPSMWLLSTPSAASPATISRSNTMSAACARTA